MKRRNKFRLSLLLLFLISTGIVRAANISVMTDHIPSANESFQLIFETSDDVDDDPDFSPLEKNLTILGRSTSSSTQIINGKISHNKKWILEVIANTAGTITVPSIHFGRDRTKPLKINISSGNNTQSNTAGNTNTNDDIFIETKISTDSPYVQAQVIYTIKLFRAINTSNASLTEPEVKNGQAVIQKLGNDVDYETQHGGRRYEVVERRYAVFPQESGKVTIEPVVFQGQTGRGGFFIDPFGPPPQTVVARSKPVELNVKPIPAAFTGSHWLPARNVNIQEQWSHDPSSIPSGEAVTRTVTLHADGLPASQLPDTSSTLSNDFKQYPDQPVLNEHSDDKGLSGNREEKTAIVPLKNGDYVLPEISIPWWNTETDKPETAVLPERHITIVAGNNTNVVTPGQRTTPVTNNSVPEKTNSTVNKPQSIPVVATNTESHWKWISLMFGIFWFITLLLWWLSLRNHGKNRKNEPSKSPVGHQEFSQTALKQACKSNDPGKAKQALLEWGRITWPEDPPASLGILANRCPEDLSLQIMRINEFLYSKNRTVWNGELLWNAFLAANRKPGKTVKTDTSDLEPLYKLQ